MSPERRFVGLLVVLCTTFLVSTIWLFVANDQASKRLSSVTKSVAARAYVSQLNFIRLSDALETCNVNVGCVYADVERRVASLARNLVDLLGSLGPARSAGLHETPIGLLIDRYGHETHDFGPLIPSALAGAATEDLAQLSAEIAPLGAMLQSIMSEVVQDVARSRIDETPTGTVDTSIVFFVLVMSWAGLTALLAIETRQRGKLLRQIRAMHDAETELQRGTVRLLQSLPVPVLLTNSEGLVYANQSARTLAAVPGQIASLSNLAQTLHSQFEPIGIDGPVTRDFTYFHGDGSLRQLSASISEIKLTGGRHRVYVILDNTLLRDAELRAMTSGKLAVLGELSSAVAHELNQPLAVIKAAAANGKMLAGNLEASQPVVDKFDRIDNQIERARRIIANVRKLGQPRPQAAAPFVPARSLSSTFGLVSEQFRLAGVALEIDVDISDTLTTVGDYTLFEIAVLNILLNAKDAFEGKPRRLPAAMVRVKGRVSDGMIRIEILDNAGGIEPDLIPRIFDSFVSSKSADKGTGLGLSIARRAIEGMNGKIAAENVDGGALFTILLPAHVKEAVS